MSFREREEARDLAAKARKHSENAVGADADLRTAVLLLSQAVERLADECEELERARLDE